MYGRGFGKGSLKASTFIKDNFVEKFRVVESIEIAPREGAPALREDFLCLLQCVVTLVHMHMKVPAEPKVNAVFVQSTMKAMVKWFFGVCLSFSQGDSAELRRYLGKKPSMNGRFAGCRLRKQTKSSL